MLLFAYSMDYVNKSKEPVSQRDFKDILYSQFSRLGHALASPKRIELLDLLRQTERTVEQLATESAAPIKNTSAHLRELRQARLVETRREGTHIYYRLADDYVASFIRQFQDLARRRLAEVEQVTTLYLDDRDEFEPVTLSGLRKLLRDDAVTVIDVRPREEFEAGHIPGALSVPLAELKGRAKELAKSKEVIAYCRGPYCVYAVEAVTALRKQGFQARRADDGFPEWRGKGYPVALGNARHKADLRRALQLARQIQK